MKKIFEIDYLKYGIELTTTIMSESIEQAIDYFKENNIIDGIIACRFKDNCDFSVGDIINDRFLILELNCDCNKPDVTYFDLYTDDGIEYMYYICDFIKLINDVKKRKNSIEKCRNIINIDYADEEDNEDE